MNWANNTEVSDYLEDLISKYKYVAITYIGNNVKRSIIEIINNDVSKYPICILEDLRSSSDETQDIALCENIKIAFFILYSLEIGEYKDINLTLDKANKISKDFTTRIMKDIEDDPYYSLKKVDVEPVLGLEGSLYGNLVTLDFRGNLLEFDMEAWSDGDAL